MAQGRNRDERRPHNEREARTVIADRWANSVAKIGTKIVGCAGICFCVYQASRVLMEWSGKTTVADVAVAFSFGERSGGVMVLLVLLSIVFSVGSIWYGLAQARLQRDTVRRLESRIRDFEEARDPHRSSSGLNSSGEEP